MILRESILCKWSPTFEINPDQFVCIKRYAPKFKAELTIFRAQERILCPQIRTKQTFGLAVTVRETDTSRIEEEISANTPDLLRMCMTACQDTIRIWAEKFLEFRLR